MTSINNIEWVRKNYLWLFPFAIILTRIIFFLSFMPYAYYGYGDIPVNFEWSSLDGWPFFDFWVEYPPLFPFISKLLYTIANGEKFIYVFLLAMVIAVSLAGVVFVFLKISIRLYGEREGLIRSLIFLVIILAYPYTWWYAEPITVFLFLTGLYFCLYENNNLRTGLWIGLGMLSKWFPVFLLTPLFRYYSLRKALLISVTALLLVTVVFGILFLVSPEMTTASLLSQPSRSSWQTLWALIDGNFTTGAFLTNEDRLNPDLSDLVYGNDPVISSRITFLFFATIGLGLWYRWKKINDLAFIAFTGIVWSIFLLWSPGWSPQWILYLIPLILLALPISKGLFITIVFILVTNFEWPLLLMSNTFESLFLIVPLRVVILIFLIFEFWKLCKK